MTQLKSIEHNYIRIFQVSLCLCLSLTSNVKLAQLGRHESVNIRHSHRVAGSIPIGGKHFLLNLFYSSLRRNRKMPDLQLLCNYGKTRFLRIQPLNVPCSTQQTYFQTVGLVVGRERDITDIAVFQQMEIRDQFICNTKLQTPQFHSVNFWTKFFVIS